MGFQPDELLADKAIQLNQSSIAGRCYTRCTYSKELICYDSREKFLGHGIKEIILRFSTEGLFESADITVDYTPDIKKCDSIAALTRDLENKLEKSLNSKGHQKYFSFPNKRKLRLKYWITGKLNIFLIHHSANYKNSGSVSFVCIRIESKASYRGNYESILKTAPGRIMPAVSYKGGKILPVPMRKQLGGLGGCWFSTIARQLAYIGSEITPIMVLVAFAGDEEKQSRKLGSLYGFRYTAKGINNKPQAAKNCIDFITRYNQDAAKRNIALIKTVSNGKHISWCENIGMIDAHFAKSLKIPALNSQQYQAFKKMVKSYIDRSLPIGWTVTRHNGKGKHRRMIIGYNEKDDLVYYSDTWGRDNIKAMPFISAYLITVWVQYITFMPIGINISAFCN